MTRKRSQNTWGDIKAKIKGKWNFFKDYEVESFQGNLENITSKLQKSHGYPREKAELEFLEFKTSIQPSVREPLSRPKNIDEMDMAQPSHVPAKSA